MQVFVTAPASYVGSAIARELLDHGHEVVGFASSPDDVNTLAAAGVGVVPGWVTDHVALRCAATGVDGVINEAPLQVGPGTDFAQACAWETQAVSALGEGLAGSGKPFVVTSGVGLLTPGPDTLAHEHAGYDPGSPAALRVPTERAALQVRDVRSSLVRFAWSVHGDGNREGFVPALIATAQHSGVSAFIGSGANRWSAVHRRDLGRLYRLALESAPAGSRLHAVAEEGVTFRDIAEAIGHRLGVPTRSIAPTEAPAHFGWLAPFVARDAAACSATTRGLVGWHPRAASLLDDLRTGTTP